MSPDPKQRHRFRMTSISQPRFAVSLQQTRAEATSSSSLHFGLSFFLSRPQRQLKGVDA